MCTRSPFAGKYMLFVFVCFLCGCSGSSTTSRLDSDDYSSKSERVEALKKEINESSDFDNAEFELFNVNGFSNSRASVPGASSWDYKYVVLVNPSDVDKWIKGMTPIGSAKYDLSWTSQIIQQRSSDWLTSGEPELYIRSGEDNVLVLYRNKGIIFRRIIAF